MLARICLVIKYGTESEKNIESTNRQIHRKRQRFRHRQPGQKIWNISTKYSLEIIEFLCFLVYNFSNIHERISVDTVCEAI